jgi:hypothetical protein
LPSAIRRGTKLISGYAHGKPKTLSAHRHRRELRRRRLGDNASGRHSVVNDAVAIYFRDPAIVIGNMAHLPSALAQLDRQTTR